MTTSPDTSRPRVADTKPVSAGILLTRDGAAALREELGRLRTKLEVEFADRLRETRGYGDLANNDDYLQTREEEAIVEARIRQLDAMLRTARIVEDGDGDDGSASVGSLVTVRDLAGGKVREHRLVGGFELRGDGYVSVNSPVGQALLGRKAGDTVAVELPTGRVAKLEVLTVLR